MDEQEKLELAAVGGFDPENLVDGEITSVIVDPDEFLTAEEDREKYFDENIRPKLSEVAELCAQQNMAYLATVMYLPNAAGTAAMQCSPPAPMIEMLKGVIGCGGDLDKLLLGLIQGAMEGGHTSNVLDALGIPRTPKK